ncbi:MAG: hypothetical protein H7096_06875 [Flavobacterium sp.]|nr:hypothetical protein [Pedobacter sp.]
MITIRIPRLPSRQLWNMNFGFFGIQFGLPGKTPTPAVYFLSLQQLQTVCYQIDTTSAIADNVFNTSDAQSAAYREADNRTGSIFTVYNGVQALAIFFYGPYLLKHPAVKQYISFV